MPLQPGDHRALESLYYGPLPLMIAGRRVKRQWFVKLDRFYRYTGEIAAALAGLGVGGPTVAALAHPDGPGFWKRMTDQLGPTWVWVGFAAIAVWITVRFVIRDASISQRATLAEAFALDNEGTWRRLDNDLGKRAPRNDIREINRLTEDRVQSALGRHIWPFDTFRPPMAAVQPELDRLIDEIRERHLRDWDPPEPGQDW